MKIVQFLFLFLLLLFPFGELLRFSVGRDIAISVNDFAVGVVVVYWFIIAKKQKIIKRPLSKGIFVFIIACFLSLIFNSKNYATNELFVSSLYLLRWIFYACLYFVVSGFDLQFKKKIVKLMIVAGSLFTVGGYIQYFFYPDLRNLYYAGWDEHLYRMFSTFLDPNFAGAFFVLYFLLILGLFFHSFDVIPDLIRDPDSEKNRITTRFRVKHGMTGRLFYGFLLLITLGAIFLTYSRSAYIMLFISGSLFVFMIISSRQVRTIIISLGLLMFLIAIVFLSKLPKSEGTDLLRTTSGEARVIAAKHAFVIFKDNPLFGVGFNAYRYAQYKYGFIDEYQQKENHAGAGTDNSFLFVLATTGIVGFGAYLYMWYSIISRHSGPLRQSSSEASLSRIHSTSSGQVDSGVVDTSQNDNQWLRIIFLSSLAGLFVNAIFINSLFYPMLMEWLWILAGLTENT